MYQPLYNHENPWFFIERFAAFYVILTMDDEYLSQRHQLTVCQCHRNWVMCVKWKPLVNSDNALHVKINFVYLYSALVHNVRQIYTDEYDFSNSSTGLETEKWLFYTNDLLRFMNYITICAMSFGSNLWSASPTITAPVGFELLLEAESFLRLLKFLRYLQFPQY
jgi:hypothetical protein